MGNIGRCSPFLHRAIIFWRALATSHPTTFPKISATEKENRFGTCRRQDLLKRHFALEPIFEKYGITMHLAVLRDDRRALDHGLFKRNRRRSSDVRMPAATLDLLDTIGDLARWVKSANIVSRAG